MTEPERGINPNDYLAAVRSNNPKLAEYWPGAKPGHPVNPRPKPSPAPTIIRKEENVATSVIRGCLPCATGHVTTCVGLLNEAMRFARTEGLDSDQVIEDTSACISELNAMERVDLRPEKVAALPPLEKELAIEVLQLSKETRLALESMRTPDDLEKIAAQLQPRQVAIFKKWFRNRLSTMTI